VKFNLLSDERDVARLMFGLKLGLEIISDTHMAGVMNEVFTANGQMVKSLWRRNVKNWLQAAFIAGCFDVAPLRRLLLAHAKLDVRALIDDSAELRKWALSRANPPHHVSCTCRMGRADDAGAVVDPDCRVRGVENLHVIDASVMPTLVRANTHLPVIMIAEKVADRLRAEHR